jgi:nucleotidyltransferase/DNA polymerase involved in DNA repair
MKSGRGKRISSCAFWQPRLDVFHDRAERDSQRRAIKQAVREETGLVASVGVAPNKFLAKIASDLKKPVGRRASLEAGPRDR